MICKHLRDNNALRLQIQNFLKCKNECDGFQYHIFHVVYLYCSLTTKPFHNLHKNVHEIFIKYLTTKLYIPSSSPSATTTHYILNGISMAVITFRVTLNTINATLTTGAGITFSFRSPANSARHPTYLGPTHGTFQPIASPFLHQYNLQCCGTLKAFSIFDIRNFLRFIYLTNWTVHGISFLNHFSEHVFGSSRFGIAVTVTVHLILILFTIQTVVNYLQ